MPKNNIETELAAIWQELQKLVTELKTATPARKLQIQAEIVTLSEQQAALLQDSGQVRSVIFTSTSRRGTGWIEEDRNFDGGVKQYRYGYYANGKSHRRYLPKALVSQVQMMIGDGANPADILIFMEQYQQSKPKKKVKIQ